MPPAKKATPRKTQKQPGDFTGRQLEQLRQEADEQEVDRSKELTMATATAQERIDNTIVDLSDPEHPVEEEAEPTGGFSDGALDDEEVEEVVETETGEPMVVIRLIGDLKTNVGYGNNYEFEAGRRYRVPLFVAMHLDEKGWVYH